MRFLIVFACFWVLAGCNNSDHKPAEKKSASQHSAALNTSFNAMMNDYYALTEAFVNWDSATVDSKAKALENSLKAVSIDELKTDASVFATAGETLKNSQASAAALGKGQDMTAMRHQFHALTQNIYDLLRIVKYDEKKVYLQECPMAFNDEESGFWLTDKGEDSIRNPYLGLHHPKYGSGMIGCGSNKSTIDFQKK